MPKADLGFGHESGTIVRFAHRRRGKGGEIFNAQLLGNGAETAKRIERFFARLAIDGAAGRHRIAQTAKGAFIINRQGGARRAAIAHEANRVGANVQHALRGVGRQGAKLR